MGAQKTFALILGVVLLLVGVLGFFDNPLVGEGGAFFGTNLYQNILHVVAGLFGVYVGTKGMGPGYNMAIGWIGILLGILGFIGPIADLLADWLSINTAITVLHLAIGVVCLLVYYTASKQ